MEHTIQLTPEQFKALQSGQSITIEPPKPEIKKWEPISGEYYPNGDFTEIMFGSSSSKYRLAGLEYKTQSQAEHTAKQLRSYARHLAWLSENDDGWKANWADTRQAKYFVYLDRRACENQYSFGSHDCYKHLNTIYMSKSNAIKLVVLLNSGQVEF